MIIYLGADHRGFALKEYIKEKLKAQLRDVIDLGAKELVLGDDYPEFAAAVAKKVSEGVTADDRGIVFCGSGFGVDIVANKIRGVRSALAMSPQHIAQGRNDDNVNVLAVAADFLSTATVEEIVKAFITTPYAGEEKYARRIEEIKKLE